MKKFSIIIPTLNHLFDCLRPCVESIIKFTDLSDVEVIIVGNGCTDKTREYVLSLYDMPGATFKYVELDEPAGYPKAINAGLKIAEGEYIVLLNNDTVLMGQEKNTWLNILVDPFSIVPNCGITGPVKRRLHHLGEDFIIFFCVMIAKKVFDDIGHLDEIFYPGSGEDIDFCIRASRKGYALVQAPYNGTITQSGEYMTGNFPIFHAGEKTVHEISNWSEIFDRNMNIVNDRYKR